MKAVLKKGYSISIDTYCRLDVYQGSGWLDELVLTQDAPDRTVPIITLLGDMSITLAQEQAFEEPGVSAKDYINGTWLNMTDLDVTVVSSNNIDLFTAGTYTVTYTATDKSGNTTVVTREVIVPADTTAPEITISGEAHIVLSLGDSYVDEGATVYAINIRHCDVDRIFACRLQ